MASINRRDARALPIGAVGGFAAMGVGLGSIYANNEGGVSPLYRLLWSYRRWYWCAGGPSQVVEPVVSPRRGDQDRNVPRPANGTPRAGMSQDLLIF